MRWSGLAERWLNGELYIGKRFRAIRTDGKTASGKPSEYLSVVYRPWRSESVLGSPVRYVRHATVPRDDVNGIVFVPIPQSFQQSEGVPLRVACGMVRLYCLHDLEDSGRDISNSELVVGREVLDIGLLGVGPFQSEDRKLRPSGTHRVSDERNDAREMVKSRAQVVNDLANDDPEERWRLVVDPYLENLFTFGVLITQKLVRTSLPEFPDFSVQLLDTLIRTPDLESWSF